MARAESILPGHDFMACFRLEGQTSSMHLPEMGSWIEPVCRTRRLAKTRPPQKEETWNS